MIVYNRRFYLSRSIECLYVAALFIVIACFFKPSEFALAGGVIGFLCGIFAILSSGCSESDNSHLESEPKPWRS